MEGERHVRCLGIPVDRTVVVKNVYHFLFTKNGIGWDEPKSLAFIAGVDGGRARRSLLHYYIDDCCML